LDSFVGRLRLQSLLGRREDLRLLVRRVAELRFTLLVLA
jgi:hypothetical protein